MFFYSNTSEIEIPNNCFVVNLDLIDDFNLFLKQCYIKLKFPDYFGFNINALYDCFCDFSWIQEEVIIIIHSTVKQMKYDDLKMYVEMLYDEEQERKGYKPLNKFEIDEKFKQLKKSYEFLSYDDFLNWIKPPQEKRYYFMEEDRGLIESILSSSM